MERRVTYSFLGRFVRVSLQLLKNIDVKDEETIL